MLLGVIALLAAISLGVLRHSIQKRPRAALVVSDVYPSFMGLASPKNLEAFSYASSTRLSREVWADRELLIFMHAISQG